MLRCSRGRQKQRERGSWRDKYVDFEWKNSKIATEADQGHAAVWSGEMERAGVRSILVARKSKINGGNFLMQTSAGEMVEHRRAANKIGANKSRRKNSIDQCAIYPK